MRQRAQQPELAPRAARCDDGLPLLKAHLLQQPGRDVVTVVDMLTVILMIVLILQLHLIRFGMIHMNFYILNMNVIGVVH